MQGLSRRPNAWVPGGYSRWTSAIFAWSVLPMGNRSLCCPPTPDYRGIVTYMRAVGLLLLGVASLLAQPSKTDPRWAPLGFLIGEWVGEGSGKPGQGEGGFSFLPDQDSRILIRKNYANY